MSSDKSLRTVGKAKVHPHRRYSAVQLNERERSIESTTSVQSGINKYKNSLTTAVTKSFPLMEQREILLVALLEKEFRKFKVNEIYSLVLN